MKTNKASTKRTTKKERVTKKEKAIIKTMSDSGQSLRRIGRILGRDHHTISRHLESLDMNDPEIKKYISVLKADELNDLTLIGGMARSRLFELLAEGKTKAIETTAIMDRCFQQRRLLSGESTHNVEAYHQVARLDEHLGKLEGEFKRLEEMRDERAVRGPK